MFKYNKLVLVASLTSLLVLLSWNSHFSHDNQDDVNSTDPWDVEQHERRQLLRNVCKKHDLEAPLGETLEIWDKTYLFSVDDVHRVLYFRTPKVASTSWSNIIAHSSGVDIRPHPSMSSARWNKTIILSSFPMEEQHFRLKHYRKIIFVRHPYDRLVSAFLNKFYNIQVAALVQRYRQYFGGLIVQRYRRNTDSPGPRGYNVTFDELVRFLTDGNRIDEHFEPVWQLSAPCSVQYDFIGRYETLQEDSQMILQRINISVSQLPWKNKSQNSPDKVLRYYRVLDADLRRRLYALFKMDFEMFGYSIENSGFD